MASTAIQGRLVFEIMSVTPLIDLGWGCVGNGDFNKLPVLKNAGQVA
jgi:hypothetical protein